MAPTIKTRLANPANYGAERLLSSIQYIVMHYTGNDGDSDEANANYFANNVVKTSAHYFVDDNSITQSVPDNRVAWHCGAKTYYHANARNYNSIGVELCDNKRDGQIVPSQATIDRALELVRWLMQCYKIPAENVIRHYDVSHKLCPAFWCGTAQKDALWRSQFWSKLNTEEKEVIPVTERRFQTLVEIEKDAPWAADTIEKLIQRDILQGTGTGLDLSRDMLRLLVINDRAGCYN